MVSKRNHPKMALFQVSEILYFTQLYIYMSMHIYVYIYICISGSSLKSRSSESWLIGRQISFSRRDFTCSRKFKTAINLNCPSYFLQNPKSHAPSCIRISIIYILYIKFYILYILYYILYILFYILYILNYILYILYGILNIIYYTFYTIYYLVYIIGYILYTLYLI